MVNPKKWLVPVALAALAAGCGGGGGGGDLPLATPPQLKLLAGAVGGAGNADGPPGIARFDQPSAVVVAADGSRYVAEARNHTIRRISPDGTVSTLAGQSGKPGSADGVGTQASFNQPLGLALDDAGGLFVADSGNHTIRRIVLADGGVSTVAGKALQPGTTSGAGAVARFNTPVSLAFHGGAAVHRRLGQPCDPGT